MFTKIGGVVAWLTSLSGIAQILLVIVQASMMSSQPTIQATTAHMNMGWFLIFIGVALGVLVEISRAVSVPKADGEKS